VGFRLEQADPRGQDYRNDPFSVYAKSADVLIDEFWANHGKLPSEFEQYRLTMEKCPGKVAGGRFRISFSMEHYQMEPQLPPVRKACASPSSAGKIIPTTQTRDA
jgi:hypothetical protein